MQKCGHTTNIWHCWYSEGVSDVFSYIYAAALIACNCLDKVKPIQFLMCLSSCSEAYSLALTHCRVVMHMLQGPMGWQGPSGLKVV